MRDDNSLAGRRIIVGISGSIAAYKAVLLVRLLVRAGAEVRVLMSENATAFVAPLTLSTLSKHPVLTSVISEEGWNNHVELGLWADAYVIAPTTANTLARLANGLCDSILAAVYLSARCPVFLAPAMDVDMWHHPSTQANIDKLISYGNLIIPVAEGELASGLVGAGRLAEPEEIIRLLSQTLATATPATASLGPLSLEGKTILVTAGPTFEAIDPVRFIGNHSSGKQGLAIVDALLQQGAKVILVLGPVQLSPKHHPNLRVLAISNASEMQAASLQWWSHCNAAILAAAVADYRPANVAQEKIKKSEEHLTLELIRNPDIAAELGRLKSANQKLIGFALETQDGEKNALAKMKRKQLDAIVLNLHGPKASAFGGDDNQVILLSSSGARQSLPRMSKVEVASHVVGLLAQLLEEE